MARRNEFRLVRDELSTTGLSAVVLLRDICVRGPSRDGRYVVVQRCFKSRTPVYTASNQRKMPTVKVLVDWRPNEKEWKAVIRDQQLERARSRSPMLK